MNRITSHSLWPTHTLFSLRKLTLCAIAVVFSWTMTVAIATSPAIAENAISHADESAYTYILAPSDHQTVSPEFTVKFGLSGMGVAPAGVQKDGTGHHHLLIDVEELPDFSQPLPSTEKIRHFGGGQTETTLTLSPGEHTLQLLLGNYTHIPHDNPVLSDKITITVE